MIQNYREIFFELKKNKGALIGLIIIGVFFTLAIFGPMLAPFSESELSEHLLKDPFWGTKFQHYHFLGTDDVGRDTFSRLLFGSRVSLFIGIFVTILSGTIGTLLGLVSGYYGGKIDKLIMRGIDILMALPSILLAIVVVSILGPGLVNAIIAVAIVSIPSFTRIVRAGVIDEKQKQYVQAARTFGTSTQEIIFKEILPNCTAPLIIQTTLCFSDGILNAAALSFLGLGAQPPTAEWGIMLSDARSFIESSPWLVTLPGLCILTVVLSFNLLGDGLRDALDPRLKKGK